MVSKRAEWSERTRSGTVSRWCTIAEVTQYNTKIRKSHRNIWMYGGEGPLAYCKHASRLCSDKAAN